MTDEDPLQHADIGETVTIEEEMDLEFWFYSIAEPYLGSDRDVDNLELVEAEFGGEEDNERIQLRVRGDVTKQLPRNWDQCCEPRTEAEATAQRRTEWKRKAWHAAGVLIPFGIVFTIGFAIANEMVESIAGQTVEFGTVTFPPVLEILPVFTIIALLAVLIVHAVSGGLPRMGVGR